MSNKKNEKQFMCLQTGEVVTIVKIVEYRYIKLSNQKTVPCHLFQKQYQPI